jgi:hypothetical protein
VSLGICGSWPVWRSADLARQEATPLPHGGIHRRYGQTQAAIFEVAKESIRSVLKALEVRSGKKVQYEDKEAEKTGNK